LRRCKGKRIVPSASKEGFQETHMKLSRESKAAYLQAAKELNKHLHSREYRLLKPEKAFISWYIFARFGKHIGEADVAIVDAPREGGVDAIVSTDTESFVLQMKYEVSPRISYVSQKDVREFEKLVRIFREEDPDLRFTTWLIRVRPQIRNRYKKIHRMMQRDPGSVRFVFVTSKLCSLEQSDWIEIEAAPNILSLWDLYRYGFTPPTESIDIRLSDDWSTGSENGNFRTYVGLADVSDFLKIMADDKNERLFAQNVRTDLRSSINVAIRETYEKYPNKFWLGNNGIYIVCKRVVQEGKIFTLHYPSVINGSQTLHSIAASNKKHPCQILVRILQMDVTGDQRLLGEIIRRTNTQNPMKLINLAAHDPYQLNIARYLDRFKIFYERREYEWKNEKRDLLTDHISVNIKDIGQWLAILQDSIGLGTIRSRVSELFQNTNYIRIFHDFDRDLVSPKYNEMAVMIWSALLFREICGELNSTQKVRAKMAQFVLIKCVYDAVLLNKEMRGVVLRMLEHHAFGRKHLPGQLVILFRKIIADITRMQRKEQSKELNIDFSNFFKRNDLTEYAYTKICQKKYLRSLARILATRIGKVA